MHGETGIRMHSYLEKRSLQNTYITPLIDILFILIIFFVLTSSYSRYRTISVVPPTEETRKEDTLDPDPLIVQVTKNGRISLDGQETSLSQLSLLKVHKDQSITLAVDLDCRFELFAKVFDVLCARSSRVNIIYKQKEKGK